MEEGLKGRGVGKYVPNIYHKPVLEAILWNQELSNS